MYVERITLENYKGFEQAEIEFSRADGQFAGWHVLAGRNGAGKSSVLMALALALRAENYAFRLLPDFDGELRALADHGKILVRLVCDPKNDQFDDLTSFFHAPAEWHGPHYPLPPDPEDGDDPRNEPPPEMLELGMELSRRRNKLVMASPITTPDFNDVQSWPKRGPWRAEAGTGWMIAGYGPQRRLQGHSNRAFELMRQSSGVASLVTLFYEDASLAEATVWLRELSQASPQMAQDLLDLLNDGLMPDGMVAKRLDEDGLLIVEQAGLELPLERLSDGYRAVAALVFDIIYRLATAYGRRAVTLDRSGGPMTINCSGVVLIDEPETHLHPNWQKRLGFWLVAHFPNLQFIVTTHSPFICQAALHGSLIRLSPPGDARPPGRLEGDDYWTVVNGSPNDAMLTNLFGLDRLISDESEQLRETIAALDAKDMESTLSGIEAEELEQARAKLPNRGSAELDRFRRIIEGMAGREG